MRDSLDRYYTPDPVAARCVGALRIPAPTRVLEPSIGADDHVLDAACLAIYGRLSSAPLTQADPTSFDPDATASEPQTRAGRNPAKTKGREDCHPRDPASNLKQRGST